VRDGQTSPHRPRLVVSRSTCPPLSPSPHANSFIIGTAVINTHTDPCKFSTLTRYRHDRDWPREEEEEEDEEEDLFVFNDTKEGPRTPAVHGYCGVYNHTCVP
jgi:hypothetical protein